MAAEVAEAAERAETLIEALLVLARSDRGIERREELDLAVVDSSPDGAGLGLSIVRSVAAAHHGDVRAHPLASGGLELSLSIPTRVGRADL